MKSSLLFFLLFPVLAFGQLQISRTEFDFGQIAVFNNDTAYFSVTNTGSKTIHLLPTQPKESYAILCESKSILPGQSIQIAIVYYTDKKGKFSIQVPIYFSHTGNPVNFTLKGQIKSIAETAYTICPSIENSTPLKPSQVPLSVIVRDAETLEFIKADEVKITNNKQTSYCVPGYNSNAFKCNCAYGPVLAEVSKKGYLPAQNQFLFEPDNNTLIIDLVKQPKDSIKQTPVWTENTNTNREKSSDEDTSVAIFDYVPNSVADSGFNSHRYRPNHLIFIIDVSGSMKDSTKLFYLKQAMTRLILTARPQDHITLITYAYKVKVVFENYSGSDRGAMLKAIDTLSAAGGSNGAMSLKMAYELAITHFIKGGNNQIFLATDGLFNSSKISDAELHKLVRKYYNSDGIILSSIGFGKDINALDFLQKLAKNGRGNFLRINNMDTDIEVLINEVKLQSLK
ncbi:MAG: VWA domain-containing protein [Bacteroidetes bacterium]|nr:VWA domain-containing protein [Bacteroidota bacterium]